MYKRTAPFKDNGTFDIEPMTPGEADRVVSLLRSITSWQSVSDNGVPRDFWAGIIKGAVYVDGRMEVHATDNRYFNLVVFKDKDDYYYLKQCDFPSFSWSTLASEYYVCDQLSGVERLIADKSYRIRR
jgi:hypothetical protein